MEDMRRAAVVFYEKSGADEQQIAKKFFLGMDTNGNGKICPNEFLEALKRVDYDQSKQDQLKNLFKKLDSNFDKNLDFFEALPFYYLIRHQTARFCSGCSVFLVGIYFSCLDCHVKDGKLYDLCSNCYKKGEFNKHIHKSLYDNVHLLQICRNLVRAIRNAKIKVGDCSGSADLGLGPDVIKQKTALICYGCEVPLASLYFSCLKCHQEDGDTYDLCIDCYEDRNSDHHIHTSLFDNNVLLQTYRQSVAKWKQNKQGQVTQVSGKDRGISSLLGISLVLSPALAVVNLASHIGGENPVTGSVTSAASTIQGGHSIASSTHGGSAQDTGSGGDIIGSAGSDAAQHGTSLADTAQQGSSLADTAQQGSSLADVAQQGSSLADLAQHGSSLADIAQQGSSLGDFAQHGSSLVDVALQGSSLADVAQIGSNIDALAVADVASNILNACSIM